MEFKLKLSSIIFISKLRFSENNEIIQRHKDDMDCEIKFGHLKNAKELFSFSLKSYT